MSADSRATLKMIINSYPDQKRKDDKYKLFVYYFLRPISFFITYIFLKLRISANTTTMLSIISALIGCLLIAVGTSQIKILGVLLVTIWAILDCVDGNIARFKKKDSLFGSFLDDLGAFLLYSLLFLSAGISLNIENGQLHHIIIGTLSSLFAILRWIVNLNYKLTFINYGKKYEKFFHNKSLKNSFLRYIYVNLATFGGFILPLLFLLTITQNLYLFNIFYLFINSTIFASILFISLKRLISLEHSKN